MGDVTVQSTPSNTPPKTVPKTQLISVRLLVNSDGKGAPAFNQGNYHDKLPAQKCGQQPNYPEQRMWLVRVDFGDSGGGMLRSRVY
jgi:hypothetical protein